VKTLLRSGVALLLLLPSLAFAAPFAYEDVDCDGFYTAGIDHIIPKVAPAPFAGVNIFSEHCLVIPKGSLDDGPWEYIFIEALGDVTIGATLRTVVGVDQFGDAWIKGGTMTVLPGTSFTAGGPVYIGANAGRMVLGDSSRYTSTNSYVDLIGYHADGSILGRGIVVRAYDSANISAFRGFLGAGLGGLNVLVTNGPLRVSGKTGLAVHGATLKAAGSVDVQTPATPLVFTNSRIKFTVPAEGFWSVVSHDFSQPCCVLGPVNVTGSQFPDGEGFIGGDPIVGQ
jgi:hypothetical protein